MKFFESQKLKIDAQTLERVLIESLNGEDLFSDVKTLKSHSPFIMKQVIFLLEPLIQFLAENSKEKKFLFDFIYQVIFAFTPYFINEEIKHLKKEKKSFLEGNIDLIRKDLHLFSPLAKIQMENSLNSLEKRVKRERHSVLSFIIL